MRRFRAVQARLQGQRIDLEKHLAFLDIRTFLEQALQQNSCRARPDLRFAHRIDSPGKFGRVIHPLGRYRRPPKLPLADGAGGARFFCTRSSNAASEQRRDENAAVLKELISYKLKSSGSPESGRGKGDQLLDLFLDI